MKKHFVQAAAYSALAFFTGISVFTGCASNKTPDGATIAAVQQTEDTAITLLKNDQYDQVRQLFETKGDISGTDEEGNTVLHIAAKKNNADLVQFFILKGADPSLKNYQSETPLHTAIKFTSLESARVLIQNGSDIFAKDGNGRTALENAVGQSAIFSDIMITDVTARMHDENGQNIVHYFVKSRNSQAVNQCIAKNVLLDEPDNDGNTPLALALKDSDQVVSAGIAAALLKAGAEPVPGDYEYFENSVLTRNLSMRFDDGQTSLHIAISAVHNGIAQYLLENGASTSAKDITGATPLHCAVRYGNVPITQLLLNYGARTNIQDSLGKTPLLLIIPKEQQNDTYKTLLASGADTTAADTYGDTVLHIATMTGASTQVLQTLLDSGANINARNKQGVTPLILAAELNNLDHVRFYVEHNADIYVQDENGVTPLLLALADPEGRLPEVVTAQTVNTHDSAGNTPLHNAILNDAPIESISYILSLHPDVNSRNSEGNTPLYLAVEMRRLDAGSLLLAEHADIFTANTSNYSPLRLALTGGESLTEWLLTSSTLSATDGNGNTVLHYAAEWQLEKSVITLLDKGCRPDDVNGNGETPLFNAAKSNDPLIINTLVKRGASIQVRDTMGSSPLHTAVRWNAVAAAQQLLNLGIDVDAQNSDGTSPLAEAALSGKKDMVDLLLSNGANPDSADVQGKTILINAIRSQNIQVVNTMLAAGANPHLQEVNGQNAYHEAVRTGNTDIIKVIRNAGANPLTRDKNGRTPFSYALPQGNDVANILTATDHNMTDSDGNTFMHIAVKEKAAQSLLQHFTEEGYPFDSRNANGETPLYIAAESNQMQTAETLLQAGANPFTTSDKNGTSPVTIAFANKNTDLLRMIARYAANKTDIKGNNLLHYAARLGTADNVRLILESGIDVQAKNIAGQTARDIAENWQHKDIADLLKQIVLQQQGQ